jgi:hypothetical protein
LRRRENHEASSFETRQRSISDAGGYIDIEMVVDESLPNQALASYPSVW